MYIRIHASYAVCAYTHSCTKVLCAENAREQNQRPIPFWGEKGQRIHNFTSTIGFIQSETEHVFMSLPDADGYLLSTGNLHDITELGTLVAPLTAQSAPGKLSQVR